MALVRRVTVGFQGANRSIKEVDAKVPAHLIPEDYREAVDVLQIPEVRRRLTVHGEFLFVKVSDPFDDDPLGFSIG